MENQQLYEKNLNYLKANLPGIYHFIQDCEPKTGFEVLQTRKAGYMSMAYTTNKGRFLLHSKYDPVREAEIWVDAQELKGKKYTVIFGCGFGYHIEALVRKHPSMSVYIYEPDMHLFLHTLRHRDWSTFPWSNVKYFVLEDGNAQFQYMLNEVLGWIKDDWWFTSIPAFEKCFMDIFTMYGSLLKVKSKEYTHGLSINVAFERLWTLNAFKNLPQQLKCHSIFRHRDFFKDKTVIMTSSGPSLNEAIPYLKKIRADRKALIVSAGSSVCGLLSHGIMPDFFVSYDPFEVNYLDFGPNLQKGAPFVFASTVYPKVVSNHVGPKAYFVLSQDTLFNYFYGEIDEEEIVSDRPTVAAVTMDLLRKMGVKKIVLAGQDLAFYDEFIYADHISYVVRPDGKMTAEEKEKQFPVEANSGEMAYTSQSLDRMRVTIESIVAEPNFPEIYNTSWHGAKIKGVPYRKWDEVMEGLMESYLGEELCFEERPESRAQLKKIKKKIEKFLGVFQGELTWASKEVKWFMENSSKPDVDKPYPEFNKVLTLINKWINNNDYNAFVRPMMRNNDHIIKKYRFDTDSMTMEEKRDFIGRQVARFLQGVDLSLQQIREAINEWDLSSE